ncbi:multicopper oxidase family protein [Plantactinospora sp. BB1]|uniref:multicopper oxidase family protein n=1 Tax=Plantactinospora sp. BB1 TaxID=2071627 RepID=UPI00131EE662|nr:multicopper oxidase domain-containing protein [Plantactinospora sp. BB1]
MTATRRKVLGWLGAGTGLLVAPAAGYAGYLWAESGRSNIGTLSFRNRLPIPPLLPPTVDADGRKRFRLTLAAGRTELLPGTSTTTWGANGPILGPTLRARRGDRVAVDVTNNLPETSSLHWHGMHLPAVMDGGPHQPIEPGRTWQPYWTVEQRAATLWYHPHLHRRTAAHVYRGVAGLFLVDDDEADALPLPRRYGVDDIPLILQDRKLHDDGTLDESGLEFGGFSLTGLLGDRILVNGGYDPYLEVDAELVRFRLLNGANARVFSVGFADDREFSLVATDAGLRDAPLPLRRLMLSPGERAEIVVRFRPGEEVLLRGFPAPMGGNALIRRLAGGADTFDLLKIVAAPALRPSPALPPRLAAAPPVPAPTRAEPYRMTMGDFRFDERVHDPTRIDRVVRAGSVETWEIGNTGGIPHNFHLHGAAFHLLDVDGRPPAAHLAGEKDTVYVPPGGRVRLAVRFLAHSDVRAPYMFHCHLLAHEDAGMMGQFIAVSARDEPRVPADLAGTHPGHGK